MKQPRKPESELTQSGTQRSRRWDRRSFLAYSGAFVAAAAAPTAVPSMMRRTADRIESVASGAPLHYANSNGLILVTVQLGGGNDGLNMVVPHNDRRYRALRGDAAVGPDQLAELGDGFGLNHMPYVGSRWDGGDLAVVHGIDYPDSSLSHFASTDVWSRGSIDPGETSGWVGRALELSAGADADPLIAISLGGVPMTMKGRQLTTTSFDITADGLTWSPRDRADAGSMLPVHEQLAQPDGSDTPLAAAVRSGHRQAFDVGLRVGPITDAATASLDGCIDGGDAGDDGLDFIGENIALNAQFDAVADLILGGLPTRAYQVHHGDFDTHDDQDRRHRALLSGLDTALRRFFERLGPAGDRIVVATWSEFGRRPEFNGSGTDHGTASSALVIGKAIAGGHHGEPVDLRKLDPDGNLIGPIDFRRYVGGVTQAVFDIDGRDVVDGSRPVLDLRA